MRKRASLRKVLDQTSVFRAEDVIPVPCHPDALAMAYAMKLNGKGVPLTGLVAAEVLVRKLVRALEDFNTRVIAVAFSPDSGILATGTAFQLGIGLSAKQEGQIRFWNVETGALVHSFQFRPWQNKLARVRPRRKNSCERRGILGLFDELQGHALVRQYAHRPERMGCGTKQGTERHRL